MDSEFDLPSRITPPQPVKRVDPVPQKRRDPEDDEARNEEDRPPPESGDEDTEPKGKSVTGGGELDLMI